MKFDPKGWAEEARLKFGVWKRERAERKAERQAQAYSEHGHGRFFLLTVPAVATILAAITEWYWAILFCIEATGAIDWNYETAFGSSVASESVWNFAFSTHWPVFVGLICATIPIVMFSMVWLPVQFAMRGTGRIRRGSVIVVGLLANILVIVSGTVVMNYNRQEQVRADLVVEQTAEANRAMLTANVDDLRAELETLMNHRSTYVATAASVGAEAYERDYVAQARASGDARLPLIERALGAARRADALRAEISAARRAVATAEPAAASTANVTDTVGRELNTFAQYVEVWRPPFIALICTLIGIFGTWWVIAMLERMNPRDVLRSGWADEGHRIEDLRAQSAVVPEPMEPAREKIYDADTGEELVHRKATWAKKPKRKGKPEQVSMPSEERGPPVDRVVNADGSVTEIERGVRTDGGNRIAVGADGKGGVMESGGGQAATDKPQGEQEPADPKADQPKADEGLSEADRAVSAVVEEIHPEPSNLSEDDLAVLYPESAAVDATENDVQSTEQGANGENDGPDTHTEPQSNPARLIAPVAAE